MSQTPRAIEVGFPIVALNPLSARERNAFKPVYKMHKWFARRSASIFRAILLGAALPAEEGGDALDLMAEFYRPHGDDPRLRRPDGGRLRVLDPFMGGGTTVVEGSRLGFDLVGVDYNPVAWFIVKGETTPVDLDALDAAFERLAAKVKEPLLELYRTPCPLTGEAADIIYAFWVKQGICSAGGCGGVTDLFKSYVVGRIQGDLGLFYLPDVVCPECDGVFDWELERCTITAGGPQVLGDGAVGKSRPRARAFAYGQGAVDCPHCETRLRSEDFQRLPKRKKKKILVQAVADPTTGDFFEVRGKLPDTVTAPESGHTFDPNSGPASRGKFTCGTCGQVQRIVDAADAHGAPLPFRYYGFYAHSPQSEGAQGDLAKEALRAGLPTNNHKWFAAAAPGDQAKVREAEAELARVGGALPIPDQEIPEGRNFRDLRRQGYGHWSDLFGPRQLLALGTLLKAIAEEGDPTLRDALLGAFQSHLDNVSDLASYDISTNKLRPVTAGHDYRNPTTIAENNVWGLAHGKGAFSSCFAKYRLGLGYREAPDVATAEGYLPIEDRGSPHWSTSLHRGSAADLEMIADRSIDLVITDPPYAGSVQYAEMSDFPYVWLHQVLKDVYPEAFGAEITLKSQEIIEDGGAKGPDFFFEQLTEAWRECHRVLVDEGLLVFTFHHKEGDRWSGLLKSLFDAGFYLVAAYPTHSEALNSIVIQATKGITYDIIHVCRKRLGETTPIAWSTLRKEVRQAARQQLERLEGDVTILPAPDVWMILLGEALQRFSRHYGKVLDADGSPLDLEDALARLTILVREVRGESVALPAALQDADGLSQAYFLHVAGKAGWTRDGLHKELRGYQQTVEDLLAAELIEEVPDTRDRLRPVGPVERARRRGAGWAPGMRMKLVDGLHHMLGVAEQGGDVATVALRWRGERALLLHGFAALIKADRSVRELAELCVRTLQTLPVEETPKHEQLKLEL